MFSYSKYSHFFQTQKIHNHGLNIFLSCSDFEMAEEICAAYGTKLVKLKPMSLVTI